MKPFSLTYWRRFLAKEWLPMLISLVVAVVLWRFVGGEQTVDKSVMIPVEVINLPRHLVISNQFKKEIEVTVNGPRSLILGLDNKQITRQIDLSKATPGTTVITNDVDSIPVPRGITVLRVQPSTIILSLDKLIQKQLPIDPVTTGSPAAGYILKGMQMDPDNITITGPETVLSKYEVLRTKVINITGLNKDLQQQVPLDLDPAIVDLIGETTITADIHVALETLQKKYQLPLIYPKGVVGQPVVKNVQITANIPKLLIEQKTDIADMLTAIVGEGNETGLGLVKIVPARGLSLPVDIVRIDPAFVKLAPTQEKKAAQEQPTEPDKQEAE